MIRGLVHPQLLYSDLLFGCRFTLGTMPATTKARLDGVKATTFVLSPDGADVALAKTDNARDLLVAQPFHERSSIGEIPSQKFRRMFYSKKAPTKGWGGGTLGLREITRAIT
ncbi:MAG: hypothetical protein C0614_12645 [Desulfuromonas sp.]|nr:MAG: hypothetical protein C0614_12645 [Desulfuromonas sp.]